MSGLIYPIQNYYISAACEIPKNDDFHIFAARRDN